MKKWLIISLVILNTLGILSFVFVNWGWVFVDRELAAEAKQFKSDLLEALNNASRVEIVEHSWHWEFGESDKLPSELPYIEYKRMRLSEGQQNEFRKIFSGMSRKPRTDFLPCAFEPHHTIEIYDHEGEQKVVKICFQCGDTSWGEETTITPDLFQSTFWKFIKQHGFQRERDWYALAQERKKATKTD
ncbi:hypothetical protein N9A94_06150 [Akkermansiaceae bacterium]|nr:hypothetical protein [Akkermansiaceae bacterium]